MADSSQIRKALVAKLAGDAALTALCPDGVYRSVSASGKTRFVIVDLSAGFDQSVFGARAIEEPTFLVKAVMLDNSAVSVSAAAARIDALLESQPLTITGYSHMNTSRVEPVEYTEVDELNNDIRWQHAGGRYEVSASL